MKLLLSALMFLIGTFGFGQTKKDVVECLNVIFSQKEFQPAFENDLTPNGAIVITVDGDPGLQSLPLQKIRSNLTQDDFYDFDHPIQVIQGGTGELERSGISSLYILDFWLSGTEKQLNIGLSSFLRYKNSRYNWTYKMEKENGKWQINGRNLNKNRR